MKFNDINFDTYFKNYPDNNGYFGKYGGTYITEELKNAMEEITEAYFTICKSTKFISELRRIRKEFQGRPTPISHLEKLSNISSRQFSFCPTVNNAFAYLPGKDVKRTLKLLTSTRLSYFHNHSLFIISHFFPLFLLY